MAGNADSPRSSATAHAADTTTGKPLCADFVIPSADIGMEY
ncbi:hypothetical protein [Kibdelosporangium aridum]|nr:hypothetical protein [Kibdelosporangium aridum]